MNSESGKVFPTINPATGEKITDVQEGDKVTCANLHLVNVQILLILFSVVSVPGFSKLVGVGGILDMPLQCHWVLVGLGGRCWSVVKY